MSKSVQERIKDLKINPYYDLWTNHMQKIYKESNAFNIMCIAFKFGYFQGQRAFKAARKKAKSKGSC